jgi:Tol biopolymer transport system component
MMSRVVLCITLLLLLSGLPAGAGPVTLLSRADPDHPSGTAGGASRTAGISSDGRYVLLFSNADNLLPGMTDSNAGDNLFLFDRMAGTTVLVNHTAGDPSMTADAQAVTAVLSADGRWVAFISTATDLVAGQVDTGPNSASAFAPDVFLWDRDSGLVSLVSHQPGLPATAAGGCWLFNGLGISADGGRVVFGSVASNLVAGQSDGIMSSDVFLYDRATDTNTLVSHAAGNATTAAGAASTAVLSADGSWVAFVSAATNVAAGQSDVNGEDDVFLYSQATGTNVLVSHAAGAATTAANSESGNTFSSIPSISISADGGQVAYSSSATNLVAGQADGNSDEDIFLYNLIAGTNTLVSHASGAATTAGNGNCWQPVVSADGRYVAYVSSSSDLVAGDTNNWWDIFTYDRIAGTNVLVSRRDAGTPAAGYSFQPSISSDGAWVGFGSVAGNLVAGMTGTAASNGNGFLWSRASGAVTLVSRMPSSPTVAGGGGGLQMSADASWIALDGEAGLASGVADLNGLPDVFLYERATGVNSLVTARGGSVSASAGGHAAYDTGRVMSNDGRFIAFTSAAPNLPGVAADTNGATDVFLADRVAGTVKLVSHANGSPATAGDDASFSPLISADGVVVVFESNASDLVSGPDSSFYEGQLYLYDRSTGGITLISHDPASASAPALGGVGQSGHYAVSGDGRWVAFSFTGSLVAGQVDTNGGGDIFLFDRTTGANTLVSHASSAPLQAGDSTSSAPSISADGRYIAFASTASNLVPGQVGAGGVFLFDQVAGTMTRVSASGGTPPVISADGRWVLFASSAPNVVPGQVDTNNATDVFLWDRISVSTLLVSRTPASATTAGNALSNLGGFLSSFSGAPPSLSADGRWVAFYSEATDLVSGQTGNAGGIYLFDRIAGTVTLVSRSASSPIDNRFSSSPALSADGRFVTFVSLMTDLVPGQVNQSAGENDFLYDRIAGTTALVSHVPSSEVTTGVLAARTEEPARISADGAWVAFASPSPDLVAGDHDGTWDAFLYANVLPGRDFFTLTPCRLLDTRQGGQGPVLSSGLRRIVLAKGACGIPDTARAIAVNLTVVQPSAGGYLTLHAGDLGPEMTSSLNFAAGQIRTNNAIVPLAFDGTGTLGVTPLVAGNGTVHLIVDVSGYFE